jgi:hypothetical protein
MSDYGLERSSSLDQQLREEEWAVRETAKGRGTLGVDPQYAQAGEARMFTLRPDRSKST